MSKHIVICDIDGTIANSDWRMHYIQKEPPDWEAFHKVSGDDPVFSDMKAILRLLCASCQVLYITGRNETNRKLTKAWLGYQEFPHGLLYMRSVNDFREDFILKQELLEERLQITPDDVLCILEDRDQVVQMYRSLGYRVLQVRNGAY